MVKGWVMMNKSIALSVLIAISFAFLGSIHNSEPVSAGDMLELHVNVNNHYPFDFDGTNIQLYFLDLGEMAISPGFDLDAQENNGFRMYFWMPENAPPGDHLVKVVASNEDFFDSKYIYVNVR